MLQGNTSRGGRQCTFQYRNDSNKKLISVHNLEIGEGMSGSLHENLSTAKLGEASLLSSEKKTFRALPETVEIQKNQNRPE